MTEEKARYYAKVLSRAIGVTFHAIRSRQSHFPAVRTPSDGCEIVATFRPSEGVNESRQSRREKVRKAARGYRRRERGSTAPRLRCVGVAPLCS